MSGICGLLNFDDAPIADHEMLSMAAILERRGPEGTGIWIAGCAGLGHTLLATTSELQNERQPFEDPATGCVITADVRLDNRDELLSILLPARSPESIGDAELILAAYLQWGDSSPERLLGDFAYAIWNPSDESLFCARDHFGMRPFYYHHAPGQRFAFASDARAVLILPQVPYQINEGRIADFLVPELEWYDYSSTFFRDVFRLPPGHRATFTRTGPRVTEYWRPQPGPVQAQMKDEDYREGFLEVFSTAIDARLRAPRGTVGAMLSGGMDSGTVVAIAMSILDARGVGPLPTFSAARWLESNEATRGRCRETAAIHAATSMKSISPTLIVPDDLDEYFADLFSVLEEPFDGSLTILKALYLAAHSRGLKLLLDGGGGDVVLHERSYIVRLLRQGRLGLAASEIRAESRHRDERWAAGRALRYVRAAVLPEIVKKPARRLRNRYRFGEWAAESGISPDLARSARIEERCERMLSRFPSGLRSDYGVEICDSIRPNMTAGRERYARIAAAAGMEARDPFMDKRVVEFCVRLPGRLRLRNGWPKAILRDVMAGILPDEVVRTPRNPHLGWWFCDAVTRLAVSSGELNPAMLRSQLEGYVDSDWIYRQWENFHNSGESGPLYHAYVLATWLRENSERPFANRSTS
jgi:asparagine synthase (glutamine-hydrolysing)